MNVLEFAELHDGVIPSGTILRNRESGVRVRIESGGTSRVNGSYPWGVAVVITKAGKRDRRWNGWSGSFGPLWEVEGT